MNDTIDELSPDARALLARASGGDDPAPSDRARVRTALMATVAGGAGLAASTAASTAAASSVSASATATGAVTMSLTAKIACAVILASAVGGTVAVAPWEPAEPAAAVEARASTEHAPRPIGPRVVADRPAVAPSLEPTPPSEPVLALAPPAEPAPIATTQTAAPRVVVRPAAPVRSVPAPLAAEPAVEPAPVEPVAAAPSTLAEEVRLLSSAQRALNEGDPTTALARLAEHGRRFPAGTMAEERDAARALALCRAGRRDEAQAAAARFLADRPTSPLAARVRASCE
jgi:hypothetical protein